MIVMDLKIMLFILLLVACGFIFLLVHYIKRYRSTTPIDEGTLLDVFRVAPFGTLLLEKDTILFSNDYAQSLLHLAPDIIVLPDVDWLPLLQEDCLAARQSDLYNGRYRIVTFASGKTARWWVIPLLHREIVFLFDITSQIHSEQIGRTLVNDLGHELRTPVATILTHLEILGLDNVGIEVQRQSLELARKEAHRMGRLINDMLELGRLEVSDDLPMRPVTILHLVNDVIVQSTPLAHENGMTLSLDADGNLPLVLGNADRLRQVFLNLVDNAIKYSSRDDSITIKIKTNERGVQCSVCDNGPGIPEEHQPHITRRFYRIPTKVVEGSGLGLALVAEILRRHQSQLQIKSPVSDGKGTCVHFTLLCDGV